MIANARLLVKEIERYVEQLRYDDFCTEYIVAETEDGKQYLIDSISTKLTHSDPTMRHMCIKLKEPTDIGGGIIR